MCYCSLLRTFACFFHFVWVSQLWSQQRRPPCSQLVKQPSMPPTKRKVTNPIDSSPEGSNLHDIPFEQATSPMEQTLAQSPRCLKRRNTTEFSKPSYQRRKQQWQISSLRRPKMMNPRWLSKMSTQCWRSLAPQFIYRKRTGSCSFSLRVFPQGLSIHRTKDIRNNLLT